MKNKTDIVSTQQFDEVIRLIQHTRSEIVRAANSQLIELYWQLGAYMSDKIESSNGEIASYSSCLNISHTQRLN